MPRYLPYNFTVVKTSLPKTRPSINISNLLAPKPPESDASTVQPAEEEIIDDADSRLSELCSVVSYLRKDVDLQLEMSKQQNERLKTHIKRLTQTVHQTRATLSDSDSKLVYSLESCVDPSTLKCQQRIARGNQSRSLVHLLLLL